MAYEALYRRYRPSTFADVSGQTHVVSALRNAVEGDRVGHAYLFSGPRGTGKTTSARILAKALNCTNLQGGEPCDACDSCEAFKSGGSYDLHELDAASNNGVDAMRDLIGKVALGSPGRTKVYILDEVHMLSSGAENALLKTLEEPPPHVVFVLATTEPNKVVPTIRSRTQHLEFGLLSATEIGDLVDYIAGDAGLEVTPEDRAYVIRAGGGSARDTLSALDQVVAAGGAPQGGEHLDALFQSLIDRDGSAALGAIEGALHAGRDPASVATALLHELRTVFLAAMRADVGHLPEAEQARAGERAASMPPARVTRAIEVIGTAIIEMRQAPDPRVDLEVAVMRLTRADLDTDPAALVERLEAVERQLAGRAPTSAPPVVASPSQAAQPVARADEPVAQAPVQPAPAPAAPSQPAPAATPAADHQAATPADDGYDQAPAQPAAPAPSTGRRGADMVRAAMVEQGIAPSAPGGATTEPVSPVAAPAAAPAPTGAKTLADVRRERQAAAEAAGTAEDPAVAANAAARRERQAAAQAQGQTSAPPAGQDQAPPQEAPVQQAPPQEAPVQQAPPQEAPVQQAPPQEAPVQQAPPQEAPVEQAPVQQAPVEQAPVQEAPVQQAPAEQEAVPAAAAPAPTAAAGGSALPTLAELQAQWQSLLESMSGRVRSRFSAGHFMETTADSVMFGLPNPVHRDRCEEIRAEVDEAMASLFGRPIPLTLVVDMVEEEPDFFAAPPSGGAGGVDEPQDLSPEEETVDVHDLVDATGDVPSAEDRVMATFEGSTLLEEPQQPIN